LENEGKKNFSSDISSAGQKKDKSITAKVDPYSSSLTTYIKAQPTAPNAKSTNKFATNLSNLQLRTTDSKTKRLQDGVRAISNLCEMMHLSEVVKGLCCDKWREFENSRKKHARGGDKYLYAALIYIGCKECGYARSFQEIASQTSLDKSEIVRCYKRLIKEQKTSDIPTPKPTKKHPTTESVSDSIKSRIERIGIQLGLDFTARTKAKSFVEQYTKHLEGKKPDTVAAVCITLSLGTSTCLTQKQIATEASISTNTLRSAMDNVRNETCN